jgi:hypothetical protein
MPEGGEEMFDDTKGDIGSRELNKEGQRNGQKDKQRSTKHYREN